MFGLKRGQIVSNRLHLLRAY